MDLSDGAPPVTRRRGQELEDALLDAASTQLLEAGYAQFTIEAVAERAGTSRHVLYRRWATREELAAAALRHNSLRHPVPMPDTGTVRGDLIELLDAASTTRWQLAAIFSLQLGAYYSETESTPADLRALIRGDQPDRISVILARGVERGEIDPRRLTPRISTLPADLLRHEVMMTQRPIPMRAILEIVDEIFLPLVALNEN